MEVGPVIAAEHDLGSRILTVNHAGENRTIHIYAGQSFVARLTAPSHVSEPLELKSHEERHRANFCAELNARRRRKRCIIPALGTSKLNAHSLMSRMHKPDPKLGPHQQDKRSVVPIAAEDVEQCLYGTTADAARLR